jgi:murein DD-endopeptidase MepM/ murein hydrolase activator NlpD
MQRRFFYNRFFTWLRHFEIKSAALVCVAIVIATSEFIAPSQNLFQSRVSPTPSPIEDSQSDAIDDAVSEETQAPETSAPENLSGTINGRRGESLQRALQRLKLPDEQLQSILASLDKSGISKNITMSTPIRYTKREGAIIELSYSPVFGQEVRIIAGDQGHYKASYGKKSPERYIRCVGGQIRSSLYSDAVRAGVPAQVVREVIQALSYEINFQSDIHPNTNFEIMYERVYDGYREKVGGLLYVSITIDSAPIRVYRFRLPNGSTEFFNNRGESIRKALLRTPIDGARISSHFGNRLHPILGYTRMHKGVDFAAPIGTPVMAAGDGALIHVGPKSGYGKCVIIRHNNEYSTLYAHLSRYAKVRQGGSVKQGTIIGYVGMTGMASGPHLHHEVLHRGRAINPAKLKQLGSVRLGGRALKQFKNYMRTIDMQFAARPDTTQYAANTRLKAWDIAATYVLR